MGARIALRMLCSQSMRFSQAVLISASAGLMESSEREVRRQKDDHLAHRLRQQGLSGFLDQWYASEMWEPFRRHAR